MKKKGISAIVATVLIILITVAAITIIWAVVLPLISNNLNEAEVCLAVRQSITVNQGQFTCDNGTGANIQVARGADGYDISALTVLVTDDQGSDKGADVTTGDFPVQGAKKMISVGGIANPVEASVIATVTVDGEEITCDASIPVPVAASC